MADRWSDGDLARVEAALADALRVEVATLHLSITGADVRARVAARERERRYGWMLLAGLAAVLIVAIGVTAVPLVIDRIIGPAASPAARAEAVAVRFDDLGGGPRALVVEAVSMSGPPRLIARVPDALASLGAGIDPAHVALGSASASAAYDPEGYLALGVMPSGAGTATGIVLVYDLAHPDRAPIRVQGAESGPLGRGVDMSWGPAARLFVAPSWLVEARTAEVRSLDLGTATYPATRLGEDVTWSADGRLIVVRSDPSQFTVTPGQLDVAGGGGSAAFVPGQPAALFSTTGLARRNALNGRSATIVSDASGLQVQGVGTYMQLTANSDEVAWWIIGPDEQVVGRPAWDAAGLGMWALISVDRRLDLLHLDGPGRGSRPGSVPWDGDSAAAAIAGVGADGRTLALHDGSSDLLVDGSTGAYRTLPDGDRFAGWAQAASIPVVSAQPAACDGQSRTMTAAVLSAYPDGAPRAGLIAPGSGWRPADVGAMPAANATTSAGLRLTLPAAGCAAWVTTDAVQVGDPSASPLALAGAETGMGEGVHAIAAPPAGDWIVRVRLVPAAAGPMASPSPAPVEIPSSGDLATPPASEPPTGEAVTLLFHVTVAGPGPSPFPGPSAPLASQLILGGAPDPSDLLGHTIVVPWMARAGSATAPADSVFHFGDQSSPPLRPGAVMAAVACTGRGSLRMAAAQASAAGGAPPIAADRWVSVACADGPVARTSSLVDLPPAVGGETLLVVERQPVDPREQLAYAVLVGQPTAVACIGPTIDMVRQIGLVSAPGQTPTPGVIDAATLPAGTFDGKPAPGSIAAAQPPLAGPQGVGGSEDSTWRLVLPDGLCESEYSVARVGSSSSSSSGADRPQVGTVGIGPLEAGDQVVRIEVTLVDPDRRGWPASFFFHINVGAAEASPSSGP